MTSFASHLFKTARLLALALAMVAGQRAGRASVEEAEPLHTISAVVALPLAQCDMGRPASVSGTVTLVRRFADQRDFLVVQDGESGIFVDLRNLAEAAHTRDGGVPNLGFRLGSRIKVSGTVEPGAFAPKIMAASIEVLHDGPLPAPAAVDMARLFEGVEVGRRLVLRGTVQAVTERASYESWALRIRTGGQNVVAELPQWDFPGRPDWVIDAEVEVIGVVGSLRNTRGELIAPSLTVASPADMTVITPAPDSPFSAEKLPLDTIARYRAARRGEHRVCTEGVILRAFPGRLFLFDGGSGVRVDLAANDGSKQWQPGDRVEVAGFVTMARGIAGLSSAAVRKAASGPPPIPVPVEPADIFVADESLLRAGVMARPGNHDGSLVRCRARLESVTTVGDPVLELSSRGKLFTASLPGGARHMLFARALELGSELELTGVVEAEFRARGEPLWPAENIVVKGFNLALAGPDDVIVLHAPPWWTPRRLAVAAACLAGVVAAGVIWLTILRREVRRQATAAITEAAARRQDAIEFEVSLRERNRLAADLHDTILQTVAGIGFQLHACGEAHGRDASVGADTTDPADRHLSAAKHMVEDAVSQLRGTVWSLRTLPADGITFSQALKDSIAHLSEGHAARITVAVDDVVDQLPATISGNLLQIVKEGVRNALHHGDPSMVEVQVGVDTAAAIVTASVSDDGCGFVVGRQAGSADGHFGLTGMRERAAAMGGALTIESAPRCGTTLVATAPTVGR